MLLETGKDKVEGKLPARNIEHRSNVSLTTECVDVAASDVPQKSKLRVAETQDNSYCTLKIQSFLSRVRLLGSICWIISITASRYVPSA